MSNYNFEVGDRVYDPNTNLETTITKIEGMAIWGYWEDLRDGIRVPRRDEQHCSYPGRLVLIKPKFDLVPYINRIMKYARNID